MAGNLPGAARGHGLFATVLTRIRVPITVCLTDPRPSDNATDPKPAADQTKPS